MFTASKHVFLREILYVTMDGHWLSGCDGLVAQIERDDTWND